MPKPSFQCETGRCSICNRSVDSVPGKKLIVIAHGAICYSCVKDCYKIMRSDPMSADASSAGNLTRAD